MHQVRAWALVFSLPKHRGVVSSRCCLLRAPGIAAACARSCAAAAVGSSMVFVISLGQAEQVLAALAQAHRLFRPLRVPGCGCDAMTALGCRTEHAARGTCGLQRGGYRKPCPSIDSAARCSSCWWHVPGEAVGPRSLPASLEAWVKFLLSCFHLAQPWLSRASGR